MTANWEQREMDVRSGMLLDWRAELTALQARNYSEPLDSTRAAIIRACIRRTEMELAGEA